MKHPRPVPLDQPARARLALGGGRLRGWPVRALLLALLGWLGPLLTQAPERGIATPSGWAWAGDGDGGNGGDSGGDSGDGGSDSDDSESDNGSDSGSDAEDNDDDKQEALPAAALGDAGSGDEHLAHELLALNPSSAALAHARLQTGVEVLETLQLRTLGIEVVRLRLHGVQPRAALAQLKQFDAQTFDLHHLYALAQAQPTAPARLSPDLASLQQSLGWPRDARNCGRAQTIGIVDTEVQHQHPALAQAEVRSQRLLQPGQEAAQDDHGTAIAALLVGQEAAGYRGLLPQARLLAAAPFYRLPTGQQRADALGLAQSLDWLVLHGAQVIGMSLAGPRNAVLDAALERARARGVVVVAAMGNGGRAAPPAYPAAHPTALAVTALTPTQTVYRRASQGAHVRFALPGAEIPTVSQLGPVQPRSGTSFAVPFLLAMVSQSLHERSLSPQQWFAGQGMPVQDLGAPGRDPVYGWGLPTLRPRCR